MKIIEITNGYPIALTNQENDFIRRYGNKIAISALPDTLQELVRKMVIKGIYIPDKMSNTVHLNLRDTN